MSGAWPAGTAHLALGEVTSTLDEARARFAALAAPTWITSARQTAGRGRRGRAWLSPSGNFAATLVLREDDPARAALRSFVAALALHDTLAALTGQPEAFSLKWPNDLLLAGAKLAGILIEGQTAGGRFAGLAIGIGVNLIAAPPAEALEPGALGAVALGSVFAAVPSPEAFLAALAPAWAQREAQFTTRGFAPIRLAWLDRAAHLGERITARLPNESVTGRFRTMDEAGQLVLDTPEGSRRIAAADIYF